MGGWGGGDGFEKKGDFSMRCMYNAPKLMISEIQLHIVCVLIFFQDDCPRLPSAESLRQMYDIIQDHRNGVLSAPFTQLLMSYIIAHCTKCRDSGCKVPHMAVGW